MNLEKIQRKLIQNQVSSLGIAEISLYVKDMHILFNEYDPSPQDIKKLHPEIEEYLIESIKPYPHRQSLKITVFLAENDGKTSSDTESLIRDAIHRHFSNKIKTVMFVRKREFRRWRTNLCIGVLFLGVCLSLSQILLQFSSKHPLNNLLSQSLGIIGWVALWEPATFILYGWRDITEEVAYYVRLTLARVELIGE